jgi:hypothetical protein
MTGLSVLLVSAILETARPDSLEGRRAWMNTGLVVQPPKTCMPCAAKFRVFSLCLLADMCCGSDYADVMRARRNVRTNASSRHDSTRVCHIPSSSCYPKSPDGYTTLVTSDCVRYRYVAESIVIVSAASLAGARAQCEDLIMICRSLPVFSFLYTL